MFLGLRTVIYRVDNIERAEEWYSQALNLKPYFDQPFYVGFNVGGYELGLQPDDNRTARSENGVAYWGVENIEAAYQKLIQAGAKTHMEIRDVGDKIRVATLVDPFGNVIGIIENPNFKVSE